MSPSTANVKDVLEPFGIFDQNVGEGSDPRRSVDLR
jgi:hypothetical protein